VSETENGLPFIVSGNAAIELFVSPFVFCQNIIQAF